MKVILTGIGLLIQFNCFAQAAISISNSRMFFAKNGAKEDLLIIKNPDNKDTLKLAISLHDWNYDSIGNNQIHPAGELPTSLIDYLNISSGGKLTLPPGATDTIRIAIHNIPSDSIPVRTAMLYLTQIDQKRESSPSAIKALVQMGIKIYFKNIEYPKTQIQLSDFKFEREENKLDLVIYNTGNTWLDGVIQYKLLNLNTREMIKLEDKEFFSLPTDKRQLSIQLPDDLKRGNYRVFASLEPATNNGINKAELIFTN